MTYKRPGVYLNETLTPLATEPESGGASTAVFVGKNAAGGPVDPTLVSSWSQFSQIFGGFGSGADLLPFAVYEYFNNGGGAAYVVRAVSNDAVAASVTLQDGEVAAVDVLTFTAKSAGTWGNSLTVDVAGSTIPGHFDVYVHSGAYTERFTDVSLDPSSTRYLPNIINSPYAGSSYVTASYVGPSPWTVVDTPAPVSGVSLAGGTEGTGTPDLTVAAEKMENVTGTFDINLPGVNDSTVINALVSWAEGQGNVFLVVDGLEGNDGDNPSANAAAQAGLVTGASALSSSSVVAVYGPWLVSDDPSSSVPGAQRILPPGGFVLGQYARTDTLRGVQKPAAGVGTGLRGVLGPQFRYNQTDLDTLNTSGINVLKVVPGAGTCIFGARTLSVGMPDRYLSIRRSLISLKQGLINLTRFAIFEDNDSDLRINIEALVSQYLRTQWGQGVLAGNTEAEAFSVQCDDDNNPPASVQQGVVNIQVGVALQTPAEFIVFNIGQMASGSSVTES